MKKLEQKVHQLFSSQDQLTETQVEEIRILHQEEMKQTIDDILDSFGFCESPYSPQEEREMGTFQETYKGWEIYFLIPNGGIISAIILRGELAYNFPVGDIGEEWEHHFDYEDDKGVLAHVKKAIDAVENI